MCVHARVCLCVCVCTFICVLIIFLFLHFSNYCILYQMNDVLCVLFIRSSKLHPHNITFVSLFQHIHSTFAIVSLVCPRVTHLTVYVFKYYPAPVYSMYMCQLIFSGNTLHYCDHCTLHVGCCSKSLSESSGSEVYTDPLPRLGSTRSCSEGSMGESSHATVEGMLMCVYSLVVCIWICTEWCFVYWLPHCTPHCTSQCMSHYT